MSGPKDLPDITDAGGPHAGQIVSLVPQALGRFASVALDATELVAKQIERPRSLLGDGVLTAGGFEILYGKPGLGKSWLALLLGRSLVRGEPWLGLATPTEGVRVGVMQLELGDYTLQHRLKTLGIGTHPRDRELRVVVRPYLRGVVDLFAEPGDRDSLRQWIRDDRLDVLIVDALSRAHTANENAATELGVVLAVFDVLRFDTGCTPVLVHHEPKDREGQRADNHLDALRGTSRLQSDPTLLVRVCRQHGHSFVAFAKVSEGATPEPVYYRIAEDGRPEVIDAPEAIGNKNLERVADVVLRAARPLGRVDVQESTKLGKSTVNKHLLTLVKGGRIGMIGEGRSAQYADPSVSPSPSSTPSQGDDASLLGSKDLGDSTTESSTTDPNRPSHRLPPAPLKGSGVGETVGEPDGHATGPETEGAE